MYLVFSDWPANQYKGDTELAEGKGLMTQVRAFVPYRNISR